MQGARESSFGRQELGVLVQPRCECCSWLVRRGQRWGRVGAGIDPALQKGQQNDLRRAGFSKHLNDERRLDVVEQFISLAEEVGLPMTHLAMTFAIAHPAVTSAIIAAHDEPYANTDNLRGPRTAP